MPTIITNNLKLLGAENLLSTIDLPEDTNNLYFFVGKSTAWSTTTVPTPVDSVAQENDHWANMLSLKRLTASDNVRLCIPTNQWTTSTTYAAYDDTTNVYAPSFVLADRENYRVYKCIDNNNNSASTVKPTGTLTSIFQTADGYYWKYMYTISSEDIVNFLSANWMPIQTLNSDDSGEHGAQWSIQQSSITSGIEYVKLLNGGSGYTKIISSTNLTFNPSVTMILTPPSSITTDNYYTGGTVYMHKNDGSTVQARLIVSYTASTNIATLNANWSPAIDYTDGWQYKVLPTIELNSDGANAIIEPTVSTTGIITGLTIFETGTGYHVAQPSITGCGGSGATMSVKISPKDGHGFDAVKEAKAHHLMFSTKLAYNEPGFLQTNDYRKIGLVKNVSAYGSTTIAGSSYSNFIAYQTISTTSESAAFVQDELFTQTVPSQTTGLRAKGIVIEHSVTSHTLKFYQDETTGFTPFTTTTGTPTYEIISASEKTATVGTYSAPTVEKYRGNILYVEQRSPITRDGENNESFKIIIEF